MADNSTNITLATFDFDTQRLEQNIDSLQKKLFELRTEQQRYTNQTKELQKQYNDIDKQRVELIKRGQQESQQYRDLVAQQQAVRTQMQGVYQSQRDLQIQTQATNREYNQTVRTFQTMLGAGGEILTMEEAITNALNRQVNSINDARAANSQLLAIRNQLNPADEEQLATINQLNEAYQRNIEYVRENASASERQAMNIGNYTESISEAANELNIFNGGLSGFADRAQAAGGTGNLLGNSLKTVTSSVIGLTKSMLGFIATPVGAVLALIAGAFLLIKNAMDRSQEATEKITKIFSAFTGIINFVLKALEPLGEFLIDGLVAGFELVAEIGERAMGLLADGLAFLGFDDAAESVRGFTEDIKESAKQAQALAQAEADLEKAQRKARLTQLQYQKEAEQFRQIRDDENRSIAERIKANEELGAVLERQLQEELNIAKQALIVANLRIEQEGKTKEALDAQADALTEIADIEERITGQQSEQLTNRVALQKEAQEKIKAAQDEAIKRQREALDLFIAEQGERARTLEEQLELERQIADKSIAILDAELKAKRISRTKYNTEVIKINNDLLKTQAELASENAERELADFIRNNKTKIDASKGLTDELIREEENRLDAIDRVATDALVVRLNNELITQQEFDDQLLQQAEATEIKKEEIRKKYADQRIADEKLTRELEHEAALLDLDEEGLEKFEREQLIADEQYELEKAKLDEQLANDLITKSNYNLALDNLDKQRAQTEKQIEDAKAQYKLSVASQTFASLATIAGKETAAGKAFAIAQTTIDTYQSATSAYAGMVQAIPGPIGIAAGIVAAAASVAMGIANVKKITSTKEPKVAVSGYATGGIIGDGFPIKRANGDNVLITAEKGEAILNNDQQAFIGHGLLAAAGVPGFATGGIIGGASSRQLVQNSIMNSFNETEFTETVATAVREGAAQGAYSGSNQGSAEGITGLSDNRQVQNNASF